MAAKRLDSMAQAAVSPFAVPNVRLFILFRVLFNSRFYYPVFTILFLDFGLTLSHFALLNAIWAASIVLLEVPSGALADTIGRRNLVVTAAACMVVEMCILAFAPAGDPDLLFWLFALNRILSGLAEAAASGADEALAYDSLAAAGDPNDWPKVLDKLIRVQSIGFMIAMTLGAAVYDPALVNTVLGWLGIDAQLTQQTTMRFPLYLTLGLAVACLLTTLRMRESDGRNECGEAACGVAVLKAFRITLRAGLWILRTPFALCVILFGLLFDHTVRMILTLNSQYYRIIQLPEATFGLLGSLMAVMGIFTPRLARAMAERLSPTTNTFIVAGLLVTGLTGMAFAWPYYGIIPAMVTVSVMHFTVFFVSHYLNSVTESRQRATVLSFRGLSYNLAYGAAGVLYSLLLAVLRGRAGKTMPAAGDVTDAVFKESLAWFPPYFLVLFIGAAAFAFWRLRKQ